MAFIVSKATSLKSVSRSERIFSTEPTRGSGLTLIYSSKAVSHDRISASQLSCVNKLLLQAACRIMRFALTKAVARILANPI